MVVENVLTQSGYEGKLRVIVVGVFCKYSGIAQQVSAFECLDRVQSGVKACEIFDISVQIASESDREFVCFAYLILIQEVEEPGMLIGNLFRGTEPGVHILICIVCHQCDILGIVLIERNTHLHIAVDGMVQDL